MRRDRRLPAQQLKSVALRDQHAWHVRPQTAQASAHLTRPAEGSDAALPESGDDPFFRDPSMAQLEGVLFLTKEPLSSRKLGQLASLADGTEARTLVRRLNEFYDREGTAFRVEEVAGGFQLMTRLTFASWLRRLHQSEVEIRLSAPALETLAVVAYRQPVLRVDIEAIRGVQCSEMLRQLMNLEFVKIVGRGEELGHPYLYGTTRNFLKIFGLRDLDELPRAEQLRRGDVVPEPGGETSPADEFEPIDESQEELDVKPADSEIMTQESTTDDEDNDIVVQEDDAPDDDEADEFEYEDEEELDEDDELEDDEELEEGEETEWEEVGDEEVDEANEANEVDEADDDDEADEEWEEGWDEAEAEDDEPEE